MNSAVSRAAWRRRGERILPFYSNVEHRGWWPLFQIGMAALITFMALVTGLLIAVGGSYALRFLILPISLLVGLALWMLPDVDRPVSPPFERLASAYILMAALWPGYLAVVLPGIPYLTPARIVLVLGLLTLMVTIPQFPRVRQALGISLLQDPWAKRLFLVFLFQAVMSSFWYQFDVPTLTGVLSMITLSFVPGLMAAYGFNREGAVARMVRLVVYAAIGTMLIGVLENYMQRPPWVGLLSGYLQIDPTLIEFVSSPQSRIGDGRYRIRSTYVTVVYYAQYLAVIMPLVLHAIVKASGPRRWIALSIVPLIMHTLWFINARTAVVCFLLSVAGLIAMEVVRNLRRGTIKDPLKRSITVFMLLLALAMMALAFANSHRLQVMTVGGVQHTSSTETRDRQWENTWAYLPRNPIGAGYGRSGILVGTVSRTGVPVTDSLFVNFLVDFGVLGFIGFFGCLLRCAWLAFATYLKAENEEEELAGPLGLALLSYVLACYVVSSTLSNYVAFVVVAAILALYGRQQRRLAQAVPALTARQPGTALARRPVG